MRFFHQMARPLLHHLLALNEPAASSNTAATATASASSAEASAARCALICRVYWCVGEWCESLPVLSHRAVYDSVGVGLAHSDLAVRFAAIRCLERFVVSCVEGEGGEKGGGEAAAVYSEVVEGVFRFCVALIGQLEELELQSGVMQIIRHSVAGLHYRVEPAVPLLLSALPFLWETAGQSNNPLRLALLDTVTELTKALGNRSTGLHPFSLQAIAFSLDAKASDRSYLHQVALELWAATVQSATAFTPALLDLFPLLPSVFSDEALDLTEALPIGLSLIESYALLGGREFMNSQADAVAQLMGRWQGAVAEKGLLPLSDSLETLAQLFPHEFPRVFAQPLHWTLRLLMEVQRLSEWREEEKGQSTATSTSASSHSSIALPSDLVVGRLLYPLSRLFYQSVDAGMELLRSFAASPPSFPSTASAPVPPPTPAFTPDGVLAALLRLWLDKLDSVSEVYVRKLAVLAVGRVVRAQGQSEAALAVVSEWLGAATGVQAELDSAEADGGGGGGAEGGEEGAALLRRLGEGTEAERRRRLNEVDPAASAVVLSEAVDVLSDLQAKAPPSAFQRWVGQRIPLPVQRSVERFLTQRREGGLKGQGEGEQRQRGAVLVTPLPLQPHPTLIPSSSAALPTSHSHPSLNSQWPHHRT